MNTSNYDSKTKDLGYDNSTTFSNAKFGELVKRVSALESGSSGSSSGCECNENWTKLYSDTINFTNDPIILTSSDLNGVYKELCILIHASSNAEPLFYALSDTLQLTFSYENVLNESSILTEINFDYPFTKAKCAEFTFEYNSNNETYFDTGGVVGDVKYLIHNTEDTLTEADFNIAHLVIAASTSTTLHVVIYGKKKIADATSTSVEAIMNILDNI